MGACCCKHQVGADVDGNGTSGEHKSMYQVLSPGAVGQGVAAGQGGTAGAACKQYVAVTSNSAVKVAVCVRPLLGHEKGSNCKEIVTVQPPSRVLLPPRANVGAGTEAQHDFTFDRVYRSEGLTESRALFEEMVVTVLDRFCQGFNGTVLAYGQTGSGKTYTMGTAANAGDPTKGTAPAIVPRSMQRIFDYVARASSTYDTIVKVSFVEIYNEQIQDLLTMTGPQTGGRSTPPASAVSLRETPAGEIVLEGVSEIFVQSSQEVAQVLEQGNSCRAVAAHKLNQESSRSHAIMMISMEQRAKPQALASLPPELRLLRSKLHLVDLAGSERAKDTGTQGQRFAEGVSINKGLLVLGNVINALTEGAGRRHIPYRDSKLTRLLQDSLGGNSETLFIACVSPADMSHEHTVGTLRYASRAMKITNSLALTKVSPEEELALLRGMLAQLQAENATLKKRLAEAGIKV